MSTRLGYLVPEFPSQTHAFFWREVEALRDLGATVRLISTRRPPAGSCRHAFAGPAAAETRYLYPPRWPAAAATLAARPAGAARALAYIAGLAESPPRARLRALGLLACAADLAALARAEELDHIHAQSCADAAHVVALCRLLGGPPYSLVLHGDLPVYGFDHRAKMAGAAFVATAGPHLVDQVVGQGVDPARVMPTWMGLDTDAFAPGPPREPSPPGRLHLATVARLNRCKGHRHALAAVREGVDRGLDLRYTVAGDGPDEAEIRGDVRRLGLEDRVEFPGSLGEHDVLALLRRVDAFILPSVGLGEAGPVSLMEAMAVGLPSVCSVIGATPQMMADGVEGYLVPQADEPGLLAAIGRLADDPPLRRRMGESARLRAVSTFDRRATAGRLLASVRAGTVVGATS